MKPITPVILTVTPNAALDKTYRVENFQLDRVHRPSLAITVAGGKGVNVARVYQTLGGKAVATGFLGGVTGREHARCLQAERIEGDFVRISGASRLCIAIVDPCAGTQTEVNELGPSVSRGAIGRLKAGIERLLMERRFDFVALCGSLPPGVPAALYADLIGIARRYGVPALLDSSGEALRAGVLAQPWMVKPNPVELEQLLGRSVADLRETAAAAEAVRAMGVAFVAATLGREGALLAGPTGMLLARPPQVPFASAVASGDSFVAAFLYTWLHGPLPQSPASALRVACGAGAANAAVIGAGFCSRDSIYAMAEQTEVEPFTV